jgi:glycosyltransferase involved in cell wall biosynthesis
MTAQNPSSRESPIVTVLMPVYNAADFLGVAIESILSQSFPDFELLLIHDGSTDGSEALARSFKDPRIRHISNGSNRGLVYSLNLGIEEAKGRYIARMDGDDVMATDRLETQVEYLERVKDADIVAGFVDLIDEKGDTIGVWPDDRKAVTPDEIRSMLSKTNCIAHPTVMMRADAMRAFRYRSEQGESEDYDLWLRWTAAGRKIHKLERVLLRHRIRTGSYTRERQTNVHLKTARVKARFVLHEFRKGVVNGFVLKTSAWCLKDLAVGMGKAVLQRIAAL